MIWMQQMYVRVTEAFRSILDREEGQGLVEYALILSLVSIVVITVLGILGGDVTAVFTEIETALDGVAGG